MNPLLSIQDGTIFAIGSVVFIAVLTAALGLGYARFAELAELSERDGLDEPDDGD
jgi:hypothetical protein